MSKAADILGKEAPQSARRGASVTKRIGESTHSVEVSPKKTTNQSGQTRAREHSPAADRALKYQNSAVSTKAQDGVKAKSAAGAKSKSAPAFAKRRAKTSHAAILRCVLNHLAIILALMYLVFYVIDRINNAMEFINNDGTKLLILILALCAVVNALFSLFGEKDS